MITIRESNDSDHVILGMWHKTMPSTFTCGIDRAELEHCYTNDIAVDGLQLRVELTKAELESEVPAEWPESIVVENETERQKTFVEYAGKNIQWSLDGAKANIPCSFRDENGNRMTEVKWEEIKLWIDKFGIERMLTLSEAKELRNSADYISV